MKKTTLLSLGFIAFSINMLCAQEDIHEQYSKRKTEIADSILNLPFDPSNAREGEDGEYCLQHKIKRALLEDPFCSNYIEEQSNKSKSGNDNPAAKANTMIIPVVFHLVHNNGVEKISEEQILDQLDILNRDYNLLNADATSVLWDFNADNPSATSTPANVDIDFVLATIAPDGTCFDGITETVTPVATNAPSESSLINAVKNGNDVCTGLDWYGANNRFYLNIYITGDISYVSGAAAYTYTPDNGGTNMDNGIYVKHVNVGSIGTGSTTTSRVLTHEVGHWLNLEHVWGWGEVEEAGNCSGAFWDDDGINDTPECVGLWGTGCTSANTCDLDNGYWGYDIPDNHENYLDYSYCNRMFSSGQAQRMNDALLSTQGQRINVQTSNNIAATGADGNLYLCSADFTTDRTTICAGETIQFTDESYNVVNGWDWSFEGGSPATSTDQDPMVTYNTPGTYQVSLTAHDGPANETEVRTGYITVLDNGGVVPFIETFENFTTLNNIPEFEIYNPGNNAAFSLNTTFGHTGTKCAKLMNYQQAGANIDEITSNVPLDLTNVPVNLTMSFRYSYRKRYATTFEKLQVLVSKDCGDTWSPRKTLQGDLLSTIATNSSWSPSSAADWTTVHVTNITSQYFVDNFRYKFRFEGENGNNLYLDNINVYYGDPSEELSVPEVNSTIEDLVLFPNPADNELNVQFSVDQNQASTFTVTDVTGKKVLTNNVMALTGSNLVMMDTGSFAPGMYFLNIEMGTSKQTLQFVIK